MDARDHAAGRYSGGTLHAGSLNFLHMHAFELIPPDRAATHALSVYSSCASMPSRKDSPVKSSAYSKNWSVRNRTSEPSSQFLRVLGCSPVVKTRN
jgi:hypothetical protein